MIYYKGFYANMFIFFQNYNNSCKTNGPFYYRFSIYKYLSEQNMEIEDKLLKFRKATNQQTEPVGSYLKNITNKLDNPLTPLSSFLNYLKFSLFSDSKKVDKLEESDDNISKNLNKKKGATSKTKKMSDSTVLINEIEDEEEEEENAHDQGRFRKYIIQLILKFLLWATLFAIFIKIEFGVPYFIVSLLVIICLNTNVGRKKSKISAYSVFNPNVERIQGKISLLHLR
jgi:hypothetical protein